LTPLAGMISPRTPGLASPRPAPYATIEGTPGSSSVVKRSFSVPPQDCRPILLKSLMSSGHPSALRDGVQLGQLAFGSGGPSSEDVLILTKNSAPCVEEAGALVDGRVGAMASPRNPASAGDRNLIRSRSLSSGPKDAAIGRGASPRGASPGGARMVLGQGGSQRNRAAENAWRCDLRNEISDKPWISLAAPPRISLRNAVDAGAPPTTGSRALAIRRGSKDKPNSSIRKEIWQSKSPQQLLDVHDFMKQGCADRIRTLSGEMELLNTRNATMRRHMDAFKKEAAVPDMLSLVDAVQEPREAHRLSAKGGRSNSSATKGTAPKADAPAIAG